MRPPATANDDQPGPIARRHSSTGGELAQSVLTRASFATPFRPGPRNPGHAGVAAGGASGVGLGSGRFLATAAVGAVLGAALGAGVAGAALTRAGGATVSRASSRCSGVGVQRQCKVRNELPLTPLVRTSVKHPTPSTTAATVARRRRATD